MSTYAIGDIHGNLLALDSLLAQIEPELKSADTVVFLGDYIDRGPDSKGCVDRILRFRDEAPCPVIGLLGNHEQWMLRTFDDPLRHSWLIGMEAIDTIHSYSHEAAREIELAMESLGKRLFAVRVPLPYDKFFNSMPETHKAFFRELKPYHQTSDVICVHGGCSLDGVLDPYDDNVHVWGPLGFPEDYVGTESVVYGHRDDGIVDEEGFASPCIGANHTYGIDTISRGVLTCVRFPDQRVWQSGND
jgi:serine/threonine protein phosphatase 1